MRSCYAVIALVLLAAGCGDGSVSDVDVSDVEPIEPERIVRVGTATDFAPYSYLDDDGELRGLAIDLTRAAAEVIGLHVEFRTASTLDLRRALREGEVDMVPHLPLTSSLEEQFLFSLPHTDVPDGIFVRSDFTPPRSDQRLLDWLGERTVIALVDDPSLEFVARSMSQDQILTAETPADSLRRLAAGQGDVALVPQRTGLDIVRRLGLRHLRVLPGSFEAYTRGLCFAVRPDQAELLAEFEQGIDILTRNGTYLQIYNDWEQRDLRAPDLRWLGWVLGPLLVLLGLSGVWSWSLRRTVARRTAALRHEEAERRRLEAQFQQSQKLESLGILAGGIAHDFNNLLVGILGNADLARQDLPKDSPAHEHLQSVEIAGRKAADLTRQMLAYSGKGQFVVQPIDLSRLVRDLSHLIRASVSKKAEFRRVLEPDLPTVEADPAQIRQVLVNLITNASEALADRPGTITVRTTSRYCDASYFEETYLAPRLPAGVYVVLEVVDDGSGMAQDTLQRVFDPFFSTRFTGRGLGLAATFGIIRGHRGAIRIDSTLGRGTQVEVLLPASEKSLGPHRDVGSAQDGAGAEARAEAEAKAATAGDADEPRDGPTTEATARRKILVVDDEKIVRQVASHILRHGGYEVVLAADGVEGVELFRAAPESIDLVLLDATMPRMNGAETFRALRDMDGSVRVLLSSGYDEQEVLGAVDGPQLRGFLQKPYEPQRLLDAVGRAMADGRARNGHGNGGSEATGGAS